MEPGFLLTIVGGLAVLAVIIWGVLTKRQREPTAMPEVRNFCRDWPPLSLVLDADFNDDEAQQLKHDLAAAACFWNSVHRGLFVSPGELSLRGHTVPIMDAPEWELKVHEHALAFSHLTVDRQGSLLTAAICLMPNWMEHKEVLVRALAHELGHCLGLAHDEETRESVMFPRAAAGDYQVTEKDKMFLAAVYD